MKMLALVQKISRVHSPIAGQVGEVRTFPGQMVKRGQILLQVGRNEITAPCGGEVRAVFVEEGDWVTKSPLFALVDIILKKGESNIRWG